MLVAPQAQAVADAFALGRALALDPAADGSMARIWRLETSSGRYAVKEFRAVHDFADLQSRLEASAQLADEVGRADVHTPTVLRTTAGTVLLRVDGGTEGDDVDVAVCRWVDGRPFDWARDAASVVQWLGQTVAKIEVAPDPPDPPALDPWLAS